MNLLKEFGCCKCSEKFVSKTLEAGQDNFLFGLYACRKSCRFRCRECFDSHSTCNCGNPLENYLPLFTLLALLHCPVDELKLMDIRVVISSACHKCGCKGYLYRVYFHTIMCENCLGQFKKDYWPTSSCLENWFLKIMDGVTCLRVAVTEIRETPLLIKMICPKCTKDYAFKSSRLLVCKHCNTSWSLKCNCMYAFWLILVDILSFSKKQLILSTYSKWMDAFSCSKCKNKQHETFMTTFVAEQSTNEATPLYTFFKQNAPNYTAVPITLGKFLIKEASDKNSSTADSTSRNYPPIEPRPRTYPPKERSENRGESFLESHRVVHPTGSFLDTRNAANYDCGKISAMSTGDNSIGATKCKCGRVDGLKDMFYCRTCSEHGICSLCVLRKHKLHQTEEAMNWSIMGIVSKHSEKNLKKIHACAQECRQVNSQTVQNYRQLCELLGVVYKTASTCGDIERCGEILSKCDITRVDGHIKLLLHAMKKSNDEIKEFRTMLERTSEAQCLQVNWNKKA